MRVIPAIDLTPHSYTNMSRSDSRRCPHCGAITVLDSGSALVVLSPYKLPRLSVSRDTIIRCRLCDADGAEAFAWLCEGAIDLLLINLKLPGGMSDLEIAEGARAYQPDAAVLILTGAASLQTPWAIHPRIISRPCSRRPVHRTSWSRWRRLSRSSTRFTGSKRSAQPLCAPGRRGRTVDRRVHEREL
jgi:hypothetical protein